MKRGPKPKSYRTVEFRGSVPEDLARAVDESLPQDRTTQGPRHGERSKLLIRLLRNYLNALTPTTDLSDLLTDGGNAGHKSSSPLANSPDGDEPDSRSSDSGVARPLGKDDLKAGMILELDGHRRKILEYDGRSVVWVYLFGDDALGSEKDYWVDSFLTWASKAKIVKEAKLPRVIEFE